MQKLVKDKNKTKNRKPNALISHSNIFDDALSINNPNFVNWIPFIDPQRTWDNNKEQTTETASSVSFLDILPQIFH